MLQRLHDLFGHGLGFLLFDLLHVVRSSLDRVIRRAQDFFFAAHQRGQHPAGFVVGEQGLRQGWLHAHHVDEETQGTQVAGQAVKDPRFGRHLQVTRWQQQLVDVVAHAHARVGGQVQPQHGQHAADGLQLVRHVHQGRAVERVAEELVDVLFALRQRGAQLLHDAADGLTIGDAAVEVLHPALQRRGGLALADQADAVGQALHALVLFAGLEFTIFQAGLDVQHAGGDFHGQAGLGPLGRLHGALHGIGQGRGQHLPIGEQLAQGVTDQAELLVQTAKAQGLASGNGRPAFFGAGHALERLGDGGRIVPPQRGRSQADRAVALQAKGAAHAGEHGALGGRRFLGLGAEEQQLVGQAIRRHAIASHQHAQLAEQRRQHALGVHVERDVAVGQALEEAAGQHPGGGLAVGAALFGVARQGGTDLGQVAGVLRLLALHQAQQATLEGVDRARIGLAGLDVIGRFQARLQRQRRPVLGPEIGRTRQAATHARHQGLVLREQLDGRDLLATDAAAHVVEQRKRGTLDVAHGIGRQRGRTAHELLHQRFAGAQQGRTGRQASEFERAHTLVDLLASGAQHGRVERIDVRLRGRGLVLERTVERLVCGVQRLAQLVLHPCQGAEVVCGQGGVGLQAVHGIPGVCLS